MFKSKKGFFAAMHPGLMFIMGLIVGAALTYILVTKGVVPDNLLPF